MKKKALIAGALLCLQAMGAVLAPNGKEYTEIVVDAAAPKFVQFAATDLAKYLKLTAGTSLPVVNQPSSKNPVIYVGRSKATDELGITVENVPSEGFRIVSKPDYLAIVGRDYNGEPVLIPWRHPWRASEIWRNDIGFGLFGEQGTMNGVYSFLKEYAGVRWYMPGDDGEVIQKTDNLKLSEFSKVDGPTFPQRYIYFALAGEKSVDNMLYMRRSGQGGLAPYLSMHNFDIMAKYKDDHPEYFALADGKRDFDGLCCIGGGCHLCLTNPGTVKAFAHELCEYFKDNPNNNSASVFPMDGLVRVCACPNCQAEVDNDAPSDGKFSNHIWGFVAKVADEVAKTYPDKIIACAAYESYRNPPSRIAKLPKNVGVDLVYVRDNSMIPEVNDKIHSQLEQWKERTDNIYTWVHYLKNNNAWKGLPSGYPKLFFDELQYLKKLGVWRGEMIEAEGKDIYALNNPGMSHWKLYLTMKSHWNPDYDLDAEMEEYYNLFYGPAAALMKEFWETSFDSQEKAAKACKSGNLTPDDAYPVAVLSKMNQAITAALAAVPEDSVYARRIDMVNKEFQYGRSSLVGFIQDGKKEMDVFSISDEKELDKLDKKRFVARDGSPYVPNTWVTTAHDDKDFIMRFYCYDDNMKDLKTGKYERDSDKIWGDELLELFICIDPKDDAYAMQFAVNPSGSVWDARYGVGLFSKEWNCESIRVSGTQDDKRWILTVRISLEELGFQNLKRGDRVKAEFYRARQVGKEMEYSNWSPVFQDSNWYPSRFGFLNWK